MKYKKQLQTTVVRPEILEQLDRLSHAQIGSIADAIGIQPQVVLSHIRNETPTLIKYDWLLQIKRVLNLATVEEITETLTTNEQPTV